MDFGIERFRNQGIVGLFWPVNDEMSGHLSIKKTARKRVSEL